MMGFLHATAAAHHAKQVRLRVHPDNMPARRLYENLGYRYTDADRGELVMLLDLARQA